MKGIASLLSLPFILDDSFSDWDARSHNSRNLFLFRAEVAIFLLIQLLAFSY